MHDHVTEDVTEDASGRNVSVQLLAIGPENSANGMAKKCPSKCISKPHTRVKSVPESTAAARPADDPIRSQAG